MANDLLALDTSVAVPLLSDGHQAHLMVAAGLRGMRVTLTGHSLAETYSVLTRLPGDAKVDPQDAARVLARRFEEPLLLDESTASRIPDRLSSLRIVGGAVYDALVGLAAVRHGVKLATRDRRALPTYAAVGADVDLLA